MKKSANIQSSEMNEMYHIIKFALESKFESKVQVNSLMEIIWVTPNPIVAAHKLLNLYVTAMINDECHPDVNIHELNKVFIGYDEWRDEVEYRYTAFVDGKEKDNEGNPIKEPRDYIRVMSLKRWNTGGW